MAALDRFNSNIEHVYKLRFNNNLTQATSIAMSI